MCFLPLPTTVYILNCRVQTESTGSTVENTNPSVTWVITGTTLSWRTSTALDQVSAGADDCKKSHCPSPRLRRWTTFGSPSPLRDKMEIPMLKNRKTEVLLAIHLRTRCWWIIFSTIFSAKSLFSDCIPGHEDWMVARLTWLERAKFWLLLTASYCRPLLGVWTPQRNSH